QLAQPEPFAFAPCFSVCSVNPGFGIPGQPLPIRARVNFYPIKINGLLALTGVRTGVRTSAGSRAALSGVRNGSKPRRAVEGAVGVGKAPEGGKDGARRRIACAMGGGAGQRAGKDGGGGRPRYQGRTLPPGSRNRPLSPGPSRPSTASRAEAASAGATGARSPPMSV